MVHAAATRASAFEATERGDSTLIDGPVARSVLEACRGAVAAGARLTSVARRRDGATEIRLRPRHHSGEEEGEVAALVEALRAAFPLSRASAHVSALDGAHEASVTISPRPVEAAAARRLAVHRPLARALTILLRALALGVALAVAVAFASAR